MRLITGAFLVFITSLPQLYLWQVRGSEWSGSPAYLDTDEFAYAAYTNALINGRPRQNDPYSGKDSSRYESLYSIQFLPAYVVAWTARALNISAATIFIALLPVATLLAMFALLWVLMELTGDVVLSVVGTIGVLCLGTVAAFNPIEIVTGLQRTIPFFPFARRYIPALPFPLFLVTTVFMWRALTRNLVWAVLTGIGFSILVFSYFYLWTAALAWYFTILVLWLIARPTDRKRVLQISAILLVIGSFALVPYSYLVVRRGTTIDDSHLLEFTHAPDLLRSPELYSAMLIAVLLFLWQKRKIDIQDPKVLFNASFAIAPFLIFNQQVITGRSLQPFHYSEFVTNYWVVLAAFLMLGIVIHLLPKRLLLYATLIGLFFGLILGIRGARLTIGMNAHLDEARDLVNKLPQETNAGVVVTSDLLLANSVATTTQHPVLWARHMFTFSNVGLIEQKKRFYQYLYYLGVDESEFTAALRDDFVARWEVFGAARANPVLALNNSPISEAEIVAEAKNYARFVREFDLSLATDPSLSYAVVSHATDLSNLDRWYERTVIDQNTTFVSYRLKLRTFKNMLVFTK